MIVGFPQKSTFDVLTANEVITPLINTVGVDLVIQRDSVNQVALGVGLLTTLYGDMKVGGSGIRDGGNFEFIATDGLGHISVLARIDAPVTTPAGSHVFKALPVDLAPFNQTGTIDEDNGMWLCNANDILYLYLGRTFTITDLNAGVKIEELTIWYYTSAVGDYITSTKIVSLHETDPSTKATEWQDLDDRGNGLTGSDSVIYTPNLTLPVDKCFQLEISAIVATGMVRIHSIEIIFSRV